MRTTVDLPAPLLRTVKLRAALKGTSMASEVAELIERGLHSGGSAPHRAKPRPDPPIMLPDRGRRVRSLTNSQIAKLEDAED